MSPLFALQMVPRLAISARAVVVHGTGMLLPALDEIMEARRGRDILVQPVGFQHDWTLLSSDFPLTDAHAQQHKDRRVRLEWLCAAVVLKHQQGPLSGDLRAILESIRCSETCDLFAQ